MGTFKGQIDTVTGQLNGGLKLPNTTFAIPAGGLGSVTAAITQVKPVAGKLDLETNKITATTTFLIKIVSAYESGASASSAALPTLPVTLPTLPVTFPSLPVTLPSITLPGTPPPGTSPSLNLVGKSCVTAKAISMTLKGTAKPTSGSTLLGTFTIPKFKSCGSATGLLNRLLPGPGNTFAVTATPASSTTSLPITLPSVTLPPVTLPTIPVTLPTPPVTVPTLPVTLPTPPHP